MALDATAFTDALGLRRYDLLGFSLGGFVAQEVALIRPHQAAGSASPAPAPGAGGTFTSSPAASWRSA
jgi:pimeloyl-ACP methyl ester carboxylesterase